MRSGDDVVDEDDEEDGDDDNDDKDDKYDNDDYDDAFQLFHWKHLSLNSADDDADHVFPLETLIIKQCVDCAKPWKHVSLITNHCLSLPITNYEPNINRFPH